MVSGDNEWLVADSEDEDALLPGGTGLQSPGLNSFSNLRATEASMIQTAMFTPDHPRTPQRGQQSPDIPGASLFTPPPGEATSTIDNFTSIPSPSRVSEVVAPKPKPRPRPRVRMKTAETPTDSANIASTSFSHISDPSTIPATKSTDDSILPPTATSSGFSELLGDAYSSLDIAERAKMRLRKSQTAKKPVYRQVDDVDVIELTSDDEDEIYLKPTKRQKKQDKPPPKAKAQPKPRPKPKPKVKAVVEVPPLPPDSPSSGIIPDLPPALDKPAFSSQPPASTMPTVPPSTPPQAHEPSPPSSPAINIRKRKRVRSTLPDDGDEGMDVDADILRGPSPSIPEPLPFFAPSSSSVPISDSGIDILIPTEGSSKGGKKKPAAASKKATQARRQTKAKKGKAKKQDEDDFADEAGEEPSKEPPIPAPTFDESEFGEEQAFGAAQATKGKKKLPAKSVVNRKGKAKAMVSDEEEEDLVPPPRSAGSPPAPSHSKRGATSTLVAVDDEEENLHPDDPRPPRQDPPPKATPASSLHSRAFSIKPKSTPMSELIRRVNSQPSSPFMNASRPYSPFLKSSRTMLSNIAPLHPNRRAPPPPPPRPPPPKKSKKQIEMEERIEEELSETIEGWSCMTDEERRDLRRARVDAELGYD
ncbi:hypothetical protein HYDPIDRAFT_128392 [Hydnomerulius pinastri MD-312]|nr:hypothetical protein HYDPIDRAFT_128392 [Hydnomerulius pinastri MD-312]